MERKRKKRIYLFCCILLTFLIIFSFIKKLSNINTINNNDIDTKENIIIENEVQEEKIEPEKITVYTTTAVHIRAAASLDSQIISTIDINTELIKIGEEGDWSKIIWENQERYIFSKYISTEKTIIKKQEKKTKSAVTPKNVYQEYAYSLFTQYGWSNNDFQCLVKLWEKESKWNPKAKNKKSGAYGIPQALPGSKMASEGSDWQTNYKTQIRWGLKYIKQRYGTPTAAWNSFLKKGWY